MSPLTCDVCNVCHYTEWRADRVTILVSPEHPEALKNAGFSTIFGRTCLHCLNDDPRKFSLREQVG